LDQGEAEEEDWDDKIVSGEVSKKSEDSLPLLQTKLLINTNFLMKKIIAIPLENGTLCSHFGHCQQFAIIDAENNSISGETLVTPPPHEPGLLPAWLAEKGVTDVIAGGMGQRAIDLFNQQKINVFVGAPIKKSKDLANDLLNNTLSAGANYCDH
jgi:predicted Fe-Mo cluster-binding NifX family protein